ncbi:ABC transporter ATP-binding protein [Rhodococcus sp. 06-156-3C]|nr:MULTISPECIES: ABC transporter ATP-binding protein [Rhodococcus]OZD17664.1 ABC transporter ATP-binding protein [Rhodococcus sp. 06-156-4C]OZD20302.1 ABC transporter ATP-binding protein [Rhodococcus sp. 06-156-3C]OZD21536.1 ABC transporter ATP-binding protein [Rhodococcus sp. 06-156-4a]OZD33260.1 ABC transporter ATP-binding protein [Rhodococcus sp. 06-156-3b]OZD40035.1 ABC transporter ATP-binding protein [Rhodococcus sp. 06-156-3]
MTDVDVTFGGVVALSNVSLDVRPGEVLGVIGPNGAGKTTLFNVACGLVRPHTGTLTRNGEPLSRLRPHDLPKLGMSRTLQGLGLFDRMSVVDNVMIGADRRARTGILAGLLGLPSSASDDAAVRSAAMATLERLRIDRYADRLPPSLPYAVRKRVALARALVSEPSLILLDEPASGLSSDEMAELGNEIRALAHPETNPSAGSTPAAPGHSAGSTPAPPGHSAGSTPTSPGHSAGSTPAASAPASVMLVEHHMDLVMSVCDRIFVLDFGKVIAHGSPDEIRQDPAVLAAYLGNEVTHGE